MSSSTCERGVLMTGPVSRLQLILSSAVQLEFPPFVARHFTSVSVLGPQQLTPPICRDLG